MSIATEQKVEQLLKRMDDLESEVTELRRVIEDLKIALSSPVAIVKDANAARPNKR